MNPATYARLLRYARHVSRRADEAEDLLQTVLIAALQAGRDDVDCPQNTRWIRGALRKRAAMEARTALRRRTRDAGFASEVPDTLAPVPEAFLRSLPPALARTARLALNGHTRAEIAFLLRISDTALRQRLHQIRQRWRAIGDASERPASGLRGTLPYGLIRRALLPAVHQANHDLGSHDPDGHLFVLSSAHKTPPHGN